MKNIKTPIPKTENTYGWGRIAEEARIIGYCEKLGAVDLKPPKEKTGFNK